jgi:hypothetical protein
MFYIKDLRKISNKSKPISFANDKSVIITNLKNIHFKNYISTVSEHINTWFKVNLLSLYFCKTHFIQFTTKIILLLT